MATDAPKSDSPLSESTRLNQRGESTRELVDCGSPLKPKSPPSEASGNQTARGYLDCSAEADASASTSLPNASTSITQWYGALKPPSPFAKEEVIHRRRSSLTAKAEENEHIMVYDTRELGKWETLVTYTGTIWQNPLLWWAVARILALSTVVAFIMALQPDPQSVVKANFMQLASALKLFVTFLLGFFMSTSIKRWSVTVDGFLVLFNSSRNLNMQYIALGVHDEARKLTARFGILSATFLHHELRTRAITDKKQAEEVWKEIFSELQLEGQLTAEEAEIMSRVSDRAGLCWVWVASLLGSLAQEGVIPLMASPTYGRLISLAQVAQEGIRKVRVSVAVQSPFVYVHTLAFLVHVNNIFCAIAFGCVLGTGIASVLARHDVELGRRLWGGVFDNLKGDDRGTLWGDIQTIVTAFMTCVGFPILLQAFLQIGLLLAQPFEGISAIPTMHMIDQLTRDLADQDLVGDEPSEWEKPCFKGWKPA